MNTAVKDHTVIQIRATLEFSLAQIFEEPFIVGYRKVLGAVFALVLDEVAAKIFNCIMIPLGVWKRITRKGLLIKMRC